MQALQSRPTIGTKVVAKLQQNKFIQCQFLHLLSKRSQNDLLSRRVLFIKSQFLANMRMMNMISYRNIIKCGYGLYIFHEGPTGSELVFGVTGSVE